VYWFLIVITYEPNAIGLAANHSIAKLMFFIGKS